MNRQSIRECGAPHFASEDCSMQDGQTRKLDRSEVNQRLFLARHNVSLVVLEGEAAGSEYVLEAPSLVLGRGPGADITFPDDAMSKQHLALELAAEGYRVRDMGSTNGLLLNGSPTRAADLKHGDRIQLGEHTLQYIVEKSGRVRTFDVSEEI
jgi:pSer/pThr/pTyr-binding forkhead associated (FHA) protein